MLTKIHEDLIIGAVLGDSHVEQCEGNCRIRFDQGSKQSEYLRFKHKMLSPWSLKLTEYSVPNKQKDGSYFKIRFNSITAPVFNKYREIFYPDNGKKIVPASIGELLTSELALLIWYLDDGHLRNYKGFRFSTDCYSKEDIVRLQEAVKTNFGISTVINKANSEKNTFTLNIHSRGGQADKFNNLLRPFVEKEIPSMLYKFF